MTPEPEDVGWVANKSGVAAAPDILVGVCWTLG